MDASIVTALAALAGATIGGLTSVAANWTSVRLQIRAQLFQQEKDRRQLLYREFIEDASKCYLNALQHDGAHADLPGLVGLYAKLSRMRVLSSLPVVQCADRVTQRIIDTYMEPEKTFVELREMVRTNAVDIFSDFSNACRTEFEQMHARQFYTGHF